jgi:hypothetical protein
VRRHLNGRQCVDCQERYAAVDLTLIDPSGWSGDMVNVLTHRKAGLDLIRAEIARCQIVCRACRAGRAQRGELHDRR